MKKFFLFVAFGLALSFFMSSCHDADYYTAEIAKMQDTVFKAFPSVNRVSIEVKTDFGSALEITLGDKTLYEGPEENRVKVTDQAAAIAQHIFGEKLPEKGSVVFVAEENTINVPDASKKTYDMHLKKGK